jgi:hypothetical protein
VIAMPLTRTQRRLRAEIEKIASISGMDPWNILDYEEELRTVTLEIMKNQFVRSEVVMKYTFIDELLSNIICHKYFEKPGQRFNYKRLWRTKRFRAFAHHILDGVYLLGKLRMVHDLRAVPPEVRETIERLNALRNAVAHSFFPENRYQYRRHKKVMYRDHHLFTVDGFTLFHNDCQSAINYLVKRGFGV